MSDAGNHVVVSGGFDDIRCPDVRFLQEAARFGPLHVLLRDDASLRSATGREPKLPQQERLYFLQAVRYVAAVHLVGAPADTRTLPGVPGLHPRTWVVREAGNSRERQVFCDSHGIKLRIVTEAELARFPDEPRAAVVSSARKKVLVTGCYDWFHSGHVRFFEEVCELGDLYVVVGHDANIRLLKGPGHPMFSEGQRRYMAGSIRYVTQALISTGHGWLDAEPEIEHIAPDIYAVNEDGDKPEKRDYCQRYGIEYVVLKRLPKPGLPRRDSTNLRGF